MERLIEDILTFRSPSGQPSFPVTIVGPDSGMDASKITGRGLADVAEEAIFIYAESASI